ncbi:hypothetical protein [Nocardia sp. NPDC051570]|uniref:hypothetical protein n=1 Tax=Nocardia sp. NPDC051570 TaxID=3364324 RepID=UPI0037922742
MSIGSFGARALVVAAVTAGILGGISTPTQASMPAGLGVQAETATQTGTNLEVKGTYSCGRSTKLRIRVEAASGDSVSGSFEDTLPCPGPGASFTAPVPLTEPVASTLRITVTLTGLNSRQIIASSLGKFAVSSGVYEALLLDSATVTDDGTATMKGRIRCQTDGGTRTLTGLMTYTGKPRASKPIKDITVDCPATAGAEGTWTFSGTAAVGTFRPGEFLIGVGFEKPESPGGYSLMARPTFS